MRHTNKPNAEHTPVHMTWDPAGAARRGSASTYETSYEGLYERTILLSLYDPKRACMARAASKSVACRPSRPFCLHGERPDGVSTLCRGDSPAGASRRGESAFSLPRTLARTLGVCDVRRGASLAARVSDATAERGEGGAADVTSGAMTGAMTGATTAAAIGGSACSGAVASTATAPWAGLTGRASMAVMGSLEGGLRKCDTDTLGTRAAENAAALAAATVASATAAWA